MKLYLFNIFFILILTAFIAKERKKAVKKSFNISIQQHGKSVPVSKNEVMLDRFAFDIVIEFSEPMGVLVNVSFNNKTFMHASQSMPLDELPGFQETGMAEDLLNRNKEIFVCNSAPSYWFYDSDTEHRFNSVKKSNSGIICKRTIQNLYDVDSKINTKILDIGKELYLVFISYEPGKEITDRVEVQRQYLTVKWKK